MSERSEDERGWAMKDSGPRPVTPIGILAQTLERIASQADARGYDDPGFREDLSKAVALAGGLDPYLAANATRPSAALVALARATDAEDWSKRFDDRETGRPLEREMLSGHIEGQFLRMLIKATGARRVLEIGLFTGYSALAMAEALPEDGRLIACEIDDYAADFAARQFEASPAGAKIRIERGPAEATLERLEAAGETFDLVFIDADKGGYRGYLDRLVGGSLLAGNGLILVDNTLMQGEPYAGGAVGQNGEAIADFNRAVMADDRIETVLMPLRDGITLIRRAGD